MKKKLYNIIFVITLTITVISCNFHYRKRGITIVKESRYGYIERGTKINNVREGYWITISKDSTIIIECYYVNGIENGPAKFYYESGELRESGYMIDGEYFGQWSSYWDNGKLESKGKYLKGKKIDVWEFFTSRGELDQRVLYLADTVKVLLDNHLGMPPPEIK